MNGLVSFKLFEELIEYLFRMISHQSAMILQYSFRKTDKKILQNFDPVQIRGYFAILKLFLICEITKTILQYSVRITRVMSYDAAEFDLLKGLYR